MSIKDVLALAISLEHDMAALKAAAALAHHYGARATALVVAIHPASHFAAEDAPLSEVLADIAKGSQASAAKERARIAAWLEKAPARFEVRDMAVEQAVIDREVIAHALYADLVVLARASPPQENRARRALLEHVVFGSGRPVLLVPGAWRRERTWERIVIGWNAKREAIRAVSDALPLLQAARQVVVATIDAAPSATGHGEAPGWELAAYLARHGVPAEVRNIDGLGRSESKALIDEAIAIDADLIVMGAYGHARVAEFIFGGVTRDLLNASPVPLFLAH